MLVALFRCAVVCVAANATVEAARDSLSTRALDLQLRGGRGVAHIPVSVLLVVFEQHLATEQCAAFAFEQMTALSGMVSQSEGGAEGSVAKATKRFHDGRAIDG